MKLETIRHSLAHILAYAVQELYPKVKFGIGPAIENGFYYDFDNLKISDRDLPKIEKKMKEIIGKNIKFIKKKISKTEAEKIFKNQPFKLDLLKESGRARPSPKLGEGRALPLPPGRSFFVYKSGDFLDLCAGPHIKSTKEIPIDGFKLTKIAGAYWLGKEKNKMIARIYGVAFENKNKLNKYLKMQEQAEKRDHRKLGKELELFMSDEQVGRGLIMYLPKGAFIYKKLQDYMYEKERSYNYDFVTTPVLAKEELYKKSGHLAHYKDDMYNPLDIEGENYYLKPMNCPHHHIIYKNQPKSYRDLPFRLSDFGMLHRYERSGVLFGIIRARNFHQNDAHIYCAKEQVKEELKNILKLFDEVYKDFNIKNYWFELSLPDYNDKKKYGDIKNKKMWQYSAQICRKALKEHKVKFKEIKGEAAFYGPKIDVQITNVFGKKDTIATVQVDFYMPEKFDLTFINKKGEKERPIIIHRAIMGSFDRFFAFLIEQTGAAFPVWLSPVQVWIIPIGSAHKKYAALIKEKLKKENLRIEIKDENETLSKKIREGETQKIPYLLILGGKETKNKTVRIRKRGKGDIGEIKINKFIEKIQKEIDMKK